MTVQYEDRPFAMSKEALSRLHASANIAGMPVRRYFRTKASQLVRIASPSFDLPGQPLSRSLVVGISDRVAAELVELCADLNVPSESAGELVACATFAPKVAA